MNISFNLPDDLVARLSSAGMLTDDGIAGLLQHALHARDAREPSADSPYYTLFEQTHDAVFMINLNGGMMHVNRRAVELTGYTTEELIKLTFRDLSAELNDSTTVLARLVRGEKVLPYERRFRTKDGTTFVAEVTAELVRDARGTPWYVQSVVRDITMRKQAEKMLRDSEALLRQIIDLAPVHIFAKDHNSRYIFANSALANAYGTTTDAMVGRKDSDFTRNRELAEFLVGGDRQVIETGKPLVVPEEIYTDAQGRRRILRTVKVPVDFPNLDQPAVLGVSTEITELKQAEKVLRDSEAVLRQIIDLAPVQIFAKDAEGRYILVNKSAADAYSTTIDDMIGKTDTDFTALPEQAGVYREQDRRVLETGELLHIPEEEFIDREGKTRILQISKMPLKFPDRDDLAVLGVATDITEMKRAANELRQAYRQAYELAAERQHVQILTQFIQDSSHEFRTPLSVIGTSIYLLTRATDDAKRSAHATQAIAQIERITRLLDHLQTMADLDSGLPFEFGPVNVNSLISEVVEHLQKTPDRSGQLIELNLDQSLRPVTGDHLRLQQAVEHIIDNALRFTPTGGIVSVHTTNTTDAVEIVVRDNGVGIPPDLLPHVMRRFWRRDQAHTTPGFGLGLPIVQKIVDRHSGTLALDSIEQRGTAVTIRLPAII